MVTDNAESNLQQSDFLENYWLILQLLQKNKKLTKKEKLKTGGDFFRDELHKLYETKDPWKKKFMSALTDNCKKIKQAQNKKAKYDKLLVEENCGGTKANHLDMVNSFGKDNAKQLVSLENLINKASARVFEDGMAKKNEEKYKKDDKLMPCQHNKDVGKALLGYYSDDKTGNYFVLNFRRICAFTKSTARFI